MEIYKAADNIYWVFSSSAQAVAAFIGFISAGFFFSHDRMDREVERDETLLEIYAEIKSQHFEKLCSLLWLTGLSIISSLLIVFVNGFDTGNFIYIFAFIVALLNGYTIFRAVTLVIDMVNPKKVEKTADKLIKEETSSDVTGSSTQNLSIGKFLEKFIELEQITRSLLEKKGGANHSLSVSPKFLPFSTVIRQLSQLGIIKPTEFSRLSKVTKLRNLVSHGQMEKISTREGKIIDDLIQQFKML
ncbi:hypothetical protein ACUN24_20300 [Pedobacter sp. WC2501]|uniref:hypothetical protein n=1 Tax=Pedobacter sp. WC2501 TaxID=3461400 RepID=UPI00404619A3